MVQLKAGVEENEEVNEFRFQFLMVQLKALTNYNYKTFNSNFNSLWFN